MYKKEKIISELERQQKRKQKKKRKSKKNKKRDKKTLASVEKEQNNQTS